MLDVCDVRVGNWVLKIMGTDANEKSFFEYKPIAADEYFFTWAKYCFPIKISSVILSKCGFTYNNGNWLINEDIENVEHNTPFLSYRPPQGWFLNEYFLKAQPDYLHQLQNIYYSLTGKELKVVLVPFENIDLIQPVKFFLNL
ncbi:MAG: hypothetical protein ACJ748_02540 [Flavisolibacter sp.]